MTQTDKQHHRQQFKQLRATLPMHALSQQICQQLSHWPVFQEAESILAFWPMPTEVNLCPLIQTHTTKHWYLPRTHLNNTLTAHRYTWGDPLETHTYGIQEPRASATSLKESPDIILIPALAVNAQGHRLGYGKGFYDRFLAKHQAISHLIVPLPAALYLKSFPTEPHDIRVDAVMTENGLSEFRN